MNSQNSIRLLILCLVVCSSGATLSDAVAAQETSFPYAAEVVSESVLIRSGAGERFYPTQELKSGDRLRVVRHDPGGWCVIEPPEGSFSWVPEEYVDRDSDGTGKMNTANIAAFVGTTFGDDIGVFQRRMRLNESVRILGRRTIAMEAGDIPMLKIAPPEREHRWIRKNAIAPTDPMLRRTQENDPYSIPETMGEPVDVGSNTLRAPLPGRDGVQDLPDVTESRYAKRMREVREARAELAAIDDRFRKMIEEDPMTWDLDSLERSYRTLQDQTTFKPLAGQIDIRFPAIQRYRLRQAKLRRLQQLTSATDRRDEELVASMGSANPQVAMAEGGILAGPAASGFPSPNYSPSSLAPIGMSLGPATSQPAGTSPELSDLFTGTIGFEADRVASDVPDLSLPPLPTWDLLDPSRDDGSLLGPGGLATRGSTGVAAGASAKTRYVGAGILRRAVSAENGPEYVLVTPEGKMLARVAAAKDAVTELDQHVGRSVGLQGTRFYREDLKSDYIEVSHLEAVRLQ